MLTLLIELVPDFEGSFNWDAAIFVGVVVLAGCLLVLATALATPFVAVQKGKTLKGTMLTVAAISALTGVIGGMAAGFPRGTGMGGTGSGSDAGEGDAGSAGQNAGKTGAGDANDDNVNNAKGGMDLPQVEHFFDVHFIPDEPGSKYAKSFYCEVTTYELGNGDVESSTVTIDETEGGRFLALIERKLKSWKRNSRFGSKEPVMRVFIKPNPGEGYRDDMAGMARRNGVEYSEIKKSWSDPTN